MMQASEKISSMYDINENQAIPFVISRWSISN